jgi:hypothetical protein
MAATYRIEGTRGLTKLLAIGKDLGDVARHGASAHAGARVAENRPRDREVAGQIGGGVAVAVLHPSRDGGDAGDAGAVDEHVLDLAVDGEGALLEFVAAGALDWKEKIVSLGGEDDAGLEFETYAVLGELRRPLRRATRRAQPHFGWARSQRTRCLSQRTPLPSHRTRILARRLGQAWPWW